MIARTKFTVSICSAVVLLFVFQTSVAAQNQISLSGFGQGAANAVPTGYPVFGATDAGTINSPGSDFSPLIPIIQADDVGENNDVYEPAMQATQQRIGESYEGPGTPFESARGTGLDGTVVFPDPYPQYEEITGAAVLTPERFWNFGVPSSGLCSRIHHIIGTRASGARTFSVFGGWSWLMNSNSWYGGSTEYQDGNSAGFSFGRRRNSRWRSDFEFSWNRNEQEPYFTVLPVVSGVQSFGPASQPGGTSLSYYPPVYGQVDTYSSFFNIYCDLDRPAGRCLTPYVGCGVGVVLLDGELNQYGRRADFEDDALFGFQAIGGVSKRLRGGSELFVEYRYLLTSDTYINVPPRQQNNYTFNGYSFKYRQQASDLVLGLRWTY